MTDAPVQLATAASPPTLKALIIDDFYARPTSAELRDYTNTLRQFITDDPDSGLKAWLDQNFGLSGDHKLTGYFDPLLDNGATIQRFWAMRDESPVGNKL